MKIKFAFFGSSDFSVHVLNELKIHNILPDLIITTVDKPKGRKLVLSPTPVKIWAHKNDIEVSDPVSLKNNLDLISQLKSANFDLFIVASYGKIIPKKIFDIPKHKTINIHPSILPKYRGASPIQSQILNNEKNIGVSIMQIVEEMDAGPIISKKEIEVDDWPIGKLYLEKKLAIEGARLLIHILPEWINGFINAIPQDDRMATYTKKIEKNDGFIDIDINNLNKNSLQNILKIKAFEDWPKTFFYYNNKRIIINSAHYKDDGSLHLDRVTPEGKKEMSFSDFLRGLNK